MGIITALEVQKRDKERVNVYLDGEYAFSMALIEAAKLRKGQTLTEAEIAVLRDEDAVNRTFDSAIRFLANRPRSETEVRRNLERKQIPEMVANAAVERLKTAGYLDDVAFAQYWLENRTMFKPLGSKALRYELRQKGVSAQVIETVLHSMDEEESVERAARERARKMRGMTPQEFTQKLGSFLQRRGFGYRQSRDVIEQLIQEFDAEDPEFFVSDDSE